jgi:hypothetical protein
LTEKDVIFIREHPKVDNETLATLFNVSSKAIRDVKTNKTWKRIEKIC